MTTHPSLRQYRNCPRFTWRDKFKQHNEWDTKLIRVRDLSLQNIESFAVSASPGILHQAQSPDRLIFYSHFSGYGIYNWKDLSSVFESIHSEKKTERNLIIPLNIATILAIKSIINSLQRYLGFIGDTTTGQE